jgi:hypothetical protein
MEQGVEVQSSVMDPQIGEGRSLECNTDSGQGESSTGIPNGEHGSQVEDNKREISTSSSSDTHCQNGEKDCHTSKTHPALPRPEISNPLGIETFDGDVQYQFGEPPPCECDSCILEHLVDTKPTQKKFSRVSGHQDRCKLCVKQIAGCMKFFVNQMAVVQRNIYELSKNNRNHDGSINL